MHAFFNIEFESYENAIHHFICNADLTLERMPWAVQKAVFRRLAEVAEVSKLSIEERIKYDHALKRYRDTFNTIEGVKQKGRVEVRAEGEHAKALESQSLHMLFLYTNLTQLST